MSDDKYMLKNVCKNYHISVMSIFQHFFGGGKGEGWGGGVYGGGGSYPEIHGVATLL